MDLRYYLEWVLQVLTNVLNVGHEDKKVTWEEKGWMLLPFREEVQNKEATENGRGQVEPDSEGLL